MFFRRRHDHGVDPWLFEKMALFTGGAIAALVGMFLDEPWIMVLAGALLLGGLALRLVPRGDGDDQAT
jgi:hypothetical protein